MGICFFWKVQFIFGQLLKLEIMLHLSKGIILVSVIILLSLVASCSTTRRTSVESQRRGLLMMETEHVYKNKGFYKEKKSKKRHKKSVRANKKMVKR